MSFDRVKEFEAIDEMLNQVRIACNRAGIPFIWVAAVKDDENGTEYRVATDENKEVNLRKSIYKTNALVPGSLGMDLKDDKIREIIKVLNDVKTSTDHPFTFNPEEFAASNILPKQNKNMYEYEEDGGLYVTFDDEPIEPEEEPPITLNLQSTDTLPDID